MMNSKAKVYTRVEVRQMLALSDRSMDRWLAKGIIPKPILPGRWCKEQIDAMLTPPLSATFSHPPPHEKFVAET